MDSLPQHQHVSDNPAEGCLGGSSASHHDVQVVVRQFPASYRPAVSALAVRVPDRIDVIASNPALAVALAHFNDFVSTPVSNPLDEAAVLISRRQRDALAVLGFPGTESSARTVRKLIAQSAHPGYVKIMRRLMNRGDVSRLLLHISPLTRAVLFVLANPVYAPAWNVPLLNELAQLQENPTSLGAVGDIEAAVFFSQQLAGSPPLKSLAVCRHIAEVGRVVAEFGGAVDPGPRPPNSELSRCFPDPPIPVPAYALPDGLEILPIWDAYQLYDVAVKFQICVYRYLELAAIGACAFYLLKRPEPAVFMLVPAEDSGCAGRTTEWTIAEARGPRNRRVEWQTVLMVGAFFNTRLERMDRERKRLAGSAD